MAQVIIFLWVGDDLPPASDHSRVHHLHVRGIDAARQVVDSISVDVVVSGHRLFDGNGVDLLEHVRKTQPFVARVLVTELSLAAAWSSNGLPAVDLVVAPSFVHRLVELVRRLLARQHTRARVAG